MKTCRVSRSSQKKSAVHDLLYHAPHRVSSVRVVKGKSWPFHKCRGGHRARMTRVRHIFACAPQGVRWSTSRKSGTPRLDRLPPARVLEHVLCRTHVVRFLVVRQCFGRDFRVQKAECRTKRWKFNFRILTQKHRFRCPRSGSSPREVGRAWRVCGTCAS